MNQKKDQKGANSKRTTPKDVVPQALHNKIRETVLLKNTADSKSPKDQDNKPKVQPHIAFDVWPESIEKYIDSTSKEVYKEKSYAYVSACVDSKIIWKKPQHFFKFVTENATQEAEAGRVHDDMFLMTNTDDKPKATRDDIHINPFRSTVSTDGAIATEVSVCNVIEVKTDSNAIVYDAKEAKKGKKKANDKDIGAAKEAMLSNLRVDNTSSDIINWVASNIQTIIDQNMVDCEVR